MASLDGMCWCLPCGKLRHINEPCPDCCNCFDCQSKLSKTAGDHAIGPTLTMTAAEGTVYIPSLNFNPPKAARTPDGGSAAYRALLDKAWELHVAKNKGYTGGNDDPWANFRQCEAFGVSAENGVITRMSDKWARLESLWRDAANDQVGESISDTLMDLSAYALILVCLLNEKETV